MPGKPRIWNDWLALIILLGVPMLWVFGGLSETVTGATITGWTTVLFFYFRKAPPEGGSNG